MSSHTGAPACPRLPTLRGGGEAQPPAGWGACWGGASQAHPPPAPPLRLPPRPEPPIRRPPNRRPPQVSCASRAGGAGDARVAHRAQAHRPQAQHHQVRPAGGLAPAAPPQVLQRARGSGHALPAGLRGCAPPPRGALAPCSAVGAAEARRAPPPPAVWPALVQRLRQQLAAAVEQLAANRRALPFWRAPLATHLADSPAPLPPALAGGRTAR